MSKEQRHHLLCHCCSRGSNLQKKDRVDRGIVTSLAKRNKAKLDHNSETGLLTASWHLAQLPCTGRKDFSKLLVCSAAVVMLNRKKSYK